MTLDKAEILVTLEALEHYEVAINTESGGGSDWAVEAKTDTLKNLQSKLKAKYGQLSITQRKPRGARHGVGQGAS